MLKLKLQYFGHLMRRIDSLEKILMLGNIESRRRGWLDELVGWGWVGWMASQTQWTWVWASPRRWWRTGKPGILQSMELQIVGHNWATEQQCHSSNMDGPRDCHTNWGKSGRKKPLPCDIIYMWSLKYDTNECIYET